jgi:hypothetical protein
MARIRKRQIKDLMGSAREGLQRINRNAAHQRSDAARPRKLPRDSAARRSWRLTKTWSQGLMIILAAMGWPRAYPKPEARVTTTVYD